MDIIEKQQGQTVIISISGTIDSLTAGEASNIFSQHIAAGSKQIVADLSQVKFMSSAGLRVLLSALKEVRQQGGDLFVAAPQPGVEKILELSGFTKIMKTYPSVEEAVAGFEA